jgi:hypothetical protein
MPSSSHPHLHGHGTVHSIWDVRDYIAPGIARAHGGPKHAVPRISLLYASYALQGYGLRQDWQCATTSIHP